MTFAFVYPKYLVGIEKKGITKEELLQVITWLTGFGPVRLQELIRENATFEIFFQKVSVNPNAQLTTGEYLWVSRGRNPESVDAARPLFGQASDELAKGRKMEKILQGL